MIIFKVQYLLRIPKRIRQLFLGTIKGQSVKGGLLILGQGVVHIKSNGLDGTHFELTVAEYVIGADGSEGVEIGKGTDLTIAKADALEEVVVPSSGGFGVVDSGGGLSFSSAVDVGGGGWRCDGTIGKELLAAFVFVKVER